MNELLEVNLKRRAAEVHPGDLKKLLLDFVDEALEIMGMDASTKNTSSFVNFTFELIGDRYSYLPINHIRAAFKFGAMGERGGTTKMTGRNINIWLNEQSNIFQEQMAKYQKKLDEQKRYDEIKDWKPSHGFTARAVIIKVGWLGDKRITSQEYDSFSSAKIRELLEQGYDERDIRPSMVVPDYDKHRQDATSY